MIHTIDTISHLYINNVTIMLRIKNHIADSFILNLKVKMQFSALCLLPSSFKRTKI